MDGAELVLFMLKLEVVCLLGSVVLAVVVVVVAGFVGEVCLFWRMARRLAGGCGGASFLRASGMMGDFSLVIGLALFFGLGLLFSAAAAS